MGYRYGVERCELENEHGSVGWWWLLVDRRTGEYCQGWKCETRDEALAVVRLLGRGA